MPKRYAIAPEDIEPLVDGMGSCRASVQIAVEGRPVGVMYREETEDTSDSGWRFRAAGEDEADTIVDVNVIANIDRSIVPYIDFPAGSKLVREGDQFVLVDGD